MKAKVFGVSIISDENDVSDGHHRFELLLEDVYTNMIINDSEMREAFEFLLDKYKSGEDFDFSELDCCFRDLSEVKK